MPVSYTISNCDDHIRLDVSGEYSRGKDADEAKDICRHALRYQRPAQGR